MILNFQFTLKMPYIKYVKRLIFYYDNLLNFFKNLNEFINYYLCLHNYNLKK